MSRKRPRPEVIARPKCVDGGEHDWDLGAMGPNVALMHCTKCPWSVNMKAGRPDKYVRGTETRD